MAEPLAEVVLQWIADGLAAIQKADGYYTDIGLGLITTEPTQVPDSPISHVIVSETEIIRKPDSSGRRLLATDMFFVVEFIVPKSAVGPTKLARRGRHDITRVLHRPLTRSAPKGLNELVLEGTAKLITDDERRSNYVIAQVTARAGLSESFLPATTP